MSLASNHKPIGGIPVLRLLSLGVLAFGTIPACGGADDVVDVGFVEWVGAPFTIEIPSTVRTSERFEANLTTYGDGCTSSESTEVILQADSASITPYNRERIPSHDEGCPLNVILIPHQASLMFETPGTKRIIVRGRSQPGGGPGSVATDVERDISVIVEQ